MNAKLDLEKIRYCRIHPAIGIARVGNSPDAHFIGPEAPGEVPEPCGGFKDELGRVKRQAARFRVYAYGEPGAGGEENVIGELTCAEATIAWRVHLANKKASWHEFRGRYYPDSPLRNLQVPAGSPQRAALDIDGGEQTVSGPCVTGPRFVGHFGPLQKITPPKDTGGSTDQPVGRDGPDQGITRRARVELGELLTDRAGRLLVLGGFGKSETVWNNPVGKYPEYPPDNQYYYANNDFWYDDTSDGPVTADVTLGDGRKLEVRGTSWVLCTPPRFAPNAYGLTTLLDVADQAASRKWPERYPPQRVSFTRDIYPILSRAAHLAWVNEAGIRGHGPGTMGSFVEGPLFELLRSNSQEDRVVQARQAVFKRIRDPNNAPYRWEPATGKPIPTDPKDYPAATKQANFYNMPQLSGDNSDCVTGDPTTWMALLESQYDRLARWAAGDFEADWRGEAPKAVPLAALPVQEQPAALDRAALEACIGGAFYPGIEMTYISTEPATWAEPYRLDAKRFGPGDIIKHMALPWQADFYECNSNWWPTARPDNVVTQAEYDRVLASYDPRLDGPLAAALASRPMWARGLPDPSYPSAYPLGDNMMVDHWHELGFVVAKKAHGQTVYVETERAPYAISTVRDQFYMLMNIDSYQDFLPTARKIAEHYLAQARVLMMERDPQDVPERWSFFPFSQEAFDARLEQIYNGFVNQGADEAQLTKDLMQTRDQVVNRIVQMAPFNQLDGTWLRTAMPPGTMSQVHSILFRIFMDEMGDGNEEQQHANVYTDLLKSLNIYLPDITTRAYADDPRFDDSAFPLPVFLLAMSQFAQAYLPEILGMTLQLEWEAPSLVPIVDTLRGFGIDPIYYVLHIGIDNAASGHGALAKQAVEIFLDDVRSSLGEEAMQEAWMRIWTGYVAFGTTGELGQKLADMEQPDLDTRARELNQAMQDLIVRKKPHGSKNHGKKTLGANRINDWFEDPAKFLDEMVRSGIVVKGEPDKSPIFQLMSFTGPMYHVFTDDEQQLWRDWIVSLNPPPPEPTLDLVQAMEKVIDVMRQRQTRTTGHHVRLEGPRPVKAGETGNPDDTVLEPISWWFEQPSNDFMAALRNERNGWIKRTKPMESPLVTQLLAGNGDMAQALANTFPNPVSFGQAPGKAPVPMTYKEVVIAWIEGDCPLVTEPKLRAAAVIKKPRKRIFGNGPVH